eukprot:145952-Pleurochrysis_carterae.AAC.5
MPAAQIKITRYLSRSSALPRRRAATAAGATARRSTSCRAHLTLAEPEKRELPSVAHAGKRMEASGTGCSGCDGDDPGGHALQ